MFIKKMWRKLKGLKGAKKEQRSKGAKNKSGKHIMVNLNTTCSMVSKGGGEK